MDDNFEYKELIRQSTYYFRLADKAAQEDKYEKAKEYRYRSACLYNSAMRVKP